MKMKNWIFVSILYGMIVCCSGCDAHSPESKTPDVPAKPVVILFENDVHCAVEGYARMAAARDSVRKHTPHVSTVSCGDFVQGDLVGSVSKGEYIVDIMNRVGYDVVTPGNHEFDYGMNQFYSLMDQMEAHVVCANLRDLRSDDLVFAPYTILSYGDTDVAFIGLITTETATNTSPLTYRDPAGNLIYDFMKQEFYTQTQRQIDAARAEGADYVVLLSHLGDHFSGDHATSLSLIAETTGVDVVLDGHSHSVIPDTLVPDKGGKPVLLSSTGTKFQYIGLLEIKTDGTLDTRLIRGEAADAEVERYVEEIKQKASENGKRIVGENTLNLIATDAAGNRLVRLQEMPIGNLCADAFSHILNTDIAMINGGGIRADLNVGEVTYNDLLSLFPFGNTVCTATLTGTQLADALEVSVRLLPEENGSFMQVSGLRFEVDPTIPTPVVFGEDGLFTHLTVDAPRRVSHIYVRDSESGEYHPIQNDSVYTLTGFDYHLTELGSEGIFRYATLKNDNLGTDVDILANYIEQTLGGIIAAPYDAPEGRIKIHTP